MAIANTTKAKATLIDVARALGYDHLPTPEEWNEWMHANGEQFVQNWSNPMTIWRFTPLPIGFFALVAANSLLLYPNNNVVRLARWAAAAVAVFFGVGAVYMTKPQSFLIEMFLRAAGIQVACIALSMHVAQGLQPKIPEYRDFTGKKNPAQDDYWGVFQYGFSLTAKVRMEDFDTSVVDPRRYTNKPWQQMLASIATAAAVKYITPYVYVYLGQLPGDTITFLYGYALLSIVFLLMNFGVPGYTKLPVFERHFLTAPSLPRFWSHHWHQLWGHPIRYLGFKPGRMLTGGSRYGGWVGALAFSGFFHWFIVLAFAIPKLPRNTFLYFLSQGFLMIVDNSIWGSSPKGETVGERSNDPKTQKKVDATAEDKIDAWISTIARRCFTWSALLVPGGILMTPLFPQILELGIHDLVWLVQNVWLGKI